LTKLQNRESVEAFYKTESLEWELCQKARGWT